MILSFAPYNLYIVAIISPAILFNAWMTVDPRTAFRYGYLFGIGLFGLGVSWLHISINMFGGVHLIGAILLTFVLVAYLALYPAIAGYIGRFFLRNSITYSYW